MNVWPPLLMVVVPSLFLVHVEPSEPFMVEPAAAEFTKSLPLSEPIAYEPPLPVAAIEAPDEPEDEDPLEPEDPEELPEDEPPELLLFAFAAAAAALTKPAIIEPSPIYFTPFPVRPSRCRITASCSRVSGLCGLVPSIMPASVAACHASAAYGCGFWLAFSA